MPHLHKSNNWCATVLFGTFIMLLSMSASAEPASVGQCAPNATAEANLELVRLADNEKSRTIGANALISDWRSAMPTVMHQLSKSKGSTERWSSDQFSYFLSLTDILRSTLGANVDAIRLFRSCDDPTIIKPLVWAARSENQSLRLNATLILGNVVDNTNVCFVLHQLRDRQINTPGKANLLGVVLAVSSYAYRENAKEIQSTLDILRPTVDAASTQTLKLIADISSRTTQSINKSTSLISVGLGESCANFDYNSVPD